MPVITDYMERMMGAGYSEDYRKRVLSHALAIYDEKVRMSDAGEKPMNRPTGYKKAERRREKRIKKRNWSTKGGYIAPIIIPTAPNSGLAKVLRGIAEECAEANIKFKVVEKGGPTVGRMLMRSNPTASGACNKPDCSMCLQPGGGNMCHKKNIVYEYKCVCGDGVYTGETHRNFYSRNEEHNYDYRNKVDSWMRCHQIEKHDDEEPKYKVSVLETFKDPLSRQIHEGVLIRHSGQRALNTKKDYYQTATYSVEKTVGRG